ncbi:hypothetical protein EJ02DRAFT_436865 [Clathrospora elynae]|uniref:Uncharacterized protein n=1 Tax=Clathrospora elynae TaxID=706981 RepID=A0A6A5SGN3_9PLEO|nr:hypothetical protein EJ02DRAFT_436865 [Clathrospora elynae]
MAQESHEMRGIQQETGQQTSQQDKVPESSVDPMLTRTSSMTAHEPITRPLRTSLWPLVVFAVYGTLALFSWIVLCMASKRPIGSKQDYMSFDGYEEEVTRILAKNESFLRAAQIVQSIVGLLTIPVTSAICSMAVVAFIQVGSLRTRLNLRQTMALSDQGWISPRIWTMIARVGSLPLYLAFGLTLIGGAAQILQQSLVQRQTIQIPTRATDAFITLPDVPNLIKKEDSSGNTAVILLRSMLESASEDDFEPYLWTEPAASDPWNMNKYDELDRHLDLLSRASNDPQDKRTFFAPLVSDFSSGVYIDSQYAPRINTTVEYTKISAADFPSACMRDIDGGFFAEYNAQNRYMGINLVACMPGNISESPWEATYNRQDITEELYLNVSKLYLNVSTTGVYSAYTDLYKATARSSLGYFELPSAHNGYKASTLLDKFTFPEGNQWNKRHQARAVERRDTNTTYPGNVTQPMNLSIGPLTSLTLALFSDGSFIQSRLSHPTAYIFDQPKVPSTKDESNRRYQFGRNCMTFMPLVGFMGPLNQRCWTDQDLLDEGDIVEQVSVWLSLFDAEMGAQAALTVGTFLANKMWMRSTVVSRHYNDARMVHFDEGIAVLKPNISTAGVIVGSVLLGAHLLGLLVLAVYTVIKKPFARWLGAEVMVKMGTAYAEILGAAEGRGQWRQTAGACPGFVGDERAGDNVGRMRFGAVAGLSRVRDRQFEEL